MRVDDAVAAITWIGLVPRKTLSSQLRCFFVLGDGLRITHSSMAPELSTVQMLIAQGSLSALEREGLRGSFLTDANV